MLDPDKATPEECQRWLAEEKQKMDEFERKHLASLIKNECHTNCCDCGRFVPKRNWLRKDSYWATERGKRPICRTCFDEYDDILY